MIAALAELFPEESANEVPTAVAVAGAAVATTVLPVLLAFADPVRKSATVIIWVKHIVGVVICGALIALGNWIYTLFSAQWSQAGFPDLPPMVAKAGGAQSPAPGGTPLGSGPIRGAQPAAASVVQPDFLKGYSD